MSKATLLNILALAAVFLYAEGNLVRKSVDSLTEDEILNLRNALRKVQDEAGLEGFQSIAGYHGAPAGCTMADGRKIACCIHGMPVFPHWHRLYVTQMEQSLMKEGATIGVPYWDWAKPLSDLPEIVREPLFINPEEGKAQKNPFYEGYIASEKSYTARAVDDRLFEQPASGKFTSLMEGVLLALEQEDFCNFEVQYEIAHNAIHYMVGGPYNFGMSTLEWTSYDPIFFLHHSMVDKIFAIWQELQKLRNKPSDRSDCAIQDMNKRMRPFSFDQNPYKLTRLHSKPNQVWDYTVLGYEYDNLELNGMNIADLNKLISDRTSQARVFAGFRLNGIYTSADVKIYVCIPSGDEKKDDDCTNYAGRFFVLGGPIEMPWSFDRLYLQDITETVDALHLDYDGDYYLKVDISAVNGTTIPSNTIRPPQVVYRPAASFSDAAPPKGDASQLVVRKDLSRLTPKETYELRQAMARFKRDKSVAGFQATAEYHGLPARCPRPDAKDRFACCVHGMATFVHWHRLYVVQVEDAIRRRGSPVGVPYWDWTKPMTALPALAADKTFVDPQSNERLPNPFNKGQIPLVGAETSRDVQSSLFEQPSFGHHTRLYNEVLFSLEQDNFCDFAVQFEISHNLVHALVGGSKPYSMASLHFTSYDPIFFLHHSNVDRLWAIWQQLQIIRKKPYKAYCANSDVHQSLKPFGFPAPLNSNPKTFSHAVPTNVYDYENELGYTYDSLEYGGMTMEQLDIYLEKLREQDRYFVGFNLQGIKTSALVDFKICKSDGTCGESAGSFAVLGGPYEMSWRYDRPYRYEITGALDALGLNRDSDFSVSLTMTDVNGTALDSSLYPPTSIIFAPKADESEIDTDWVIVRKDVSRITPEEATALRVALQAVEDDSSAGGFQTIAGYHGIPTICPSPNAAVKFSCCVHGMSTFAHWHRLYTVQFENALRKQGYTGALPYWDWAKPVSSLPALASDETFTDPGTGESKHNPWLSAKIDAAGGVESKRSPRQELFDQPAFGKFTSLGSQMLLAFEQDDFCDFAVQFEVTHNAIHALVGGNEPYSMASLRYTTFDPIFFLHHSSVDRYWAIWQELQRFRGKAYNKANCALQVMREPLMPFNLEQDVNPDEVTRGNAAPFRVFEYENAFGYRYDNLEFNGMSISQLSHELEGRRSYDREFATFMLHGIQQSALIKFYICLSDDDCDHYGGEFYILGDEAEMPWIYDRAYRYEITDQLKALNVRYGDRFFIRSVILDLNGNELPSDTFPQPAVVYVPARGTYGAEQEWIEPITAASRIRKDLSTLTVGETESLRNAFLRLQRDKVRGYEYIAGFHGLPAKCPSPENPQYACCLHGMPTFPHWHRLYVLQVENALLEIGSSIAVPYWDWTTRIDRLPSLVSEATFYNSRTLRLDRNPFFRGEISFENAFTTRDPQPELFNSDYLYEQILLAFEEEDFCDFEVQFEIAHNAIHALVGGRDSYSLSTLDYTAYDPIFFLHHTNVDRLWAIWQELQRYRKKPFNSAFCALPLMQNPIKPFSFNKSINGDWMTRTYSRPRDAFDYQNNFRYKYDNLNFNGMSIPKLKNLIDSRKNQDRVFAGFLLHGIQTSANVRIYICLPNNGHDDCSHYAGIFSVLGGEKEMPWAFDRLYKFEITAALRDLGLTADSSFDVNIEVTARNGSSLSSSLFPRPTIVYVPGVGSAGNNVHDNNDVPLERKRIESLTNSEISSLLMAFRSFMSDTSADGYQAIASFHALPPLCPSPTAANRFACCIHGMATFPQWHRLYVVQVENALRRQGSNVGMPYWDWIHPMTALPTLFTDDTFVDSTSGRTFNNPLKNVEIAFENSVVERDVVEDRIYEQPSGSSNTWLYNQVMLALEQTNFCDFEVQFEIAHNAIHTWVGGSKEHSLGHLHYASYDPIFFFHHSNADRIWAVWQELQRYRGLGGSEANCALELMREPLKPFSFGEPWNLNPLTQKYSRPEDTFDYENHFHYHYEHLEIAGLTVPDLDRYLKEQQEQDRVFAGFLLGGFGSSAVVSFQVCDPAGACTEGGSFSVLGGSKEMPWEFDRLYKYDITAAVRKLGARNDDALTVTVSLVHPNGSALPSTLLKAPTVFFVPGRESVADAHTPANRVRLNINSINERDIQSLMAALSELKEDESADGFAAIASFHGSPPKCKTASGNDIACCIHGMAAFPHWHRLYTVQFEDALRRHGSSVALPYWDWTTDAHLPSLVTRPNYYDAWRDTVVENPFLRGRIEHEDTYTARNIQPELTEVGSSGHNFLYESVLLAFEQEDYCDFEVQFEVSHNAIHYLVGGRHEYAMSSLSYTSYDPIFFLHHSQVDRLWAIWQALQKYRKQPYNKAYCAVESMTKPMKPFSFDETFNLNPVTRAHSTPDSVFDYEDLGYTYENLRFNGNSIEELNEIVERRKQSDRVFANFLLHGIGTSADVHFSVCAREGVCQKAGLFFVLGSDLEMPWAFDRTFKYDITGAVNKLGLSLGEDSYYLDVSIVAVNGTELSNDVLPAPTLSYVPATSSSRREEGDLVGAPGIRKNVDDLSPSEIENLRDALRQVQEDTSERGFRAIAAYHGLPAQCMTPDGEDTMACCVHGMPNFPHWHRLYTKQMEDALALKGARLGIPYWDWTQPFKNLPYLVTSNDNNPFYRGEVSDGIYTTRDPVPNLFRDPQFGEKSFFYRQVLYTLEQTDYCDFEIQFEVSHNAIHSWVGGESPYSMSTLHYTSYDPLFYLHHSNTDRLWAIWQALQKYRGLPYKTANCAIPLLRKPLNPFSRESNWNALTRTNSRPIDVFDYQRLGYQYDNLRFDGMDIPKLESVLRENRGKDRVFAGFLLSGFQASADVRFDVCLPSGECEFAGTFAVLGGTKEMPWAFDRLFKYEITEALSALRADYRTVFTVETTIIATNKTELSSNLIPRPTVIYEPGTRSSSVAQTSPPRSNVLLRKELNTLTLEEAENLREAMFQMMNDEGSSGFEHIATFHGAPGKCPQGATENTFSCCIHGMPSFPHWHRLYVIQAEQALQAHGSNVGIPYWDWTKAMRALPSFVSQSENNPWYRGYIRFEQVYTTRTVDPRLFNPPQVSGHNFLHHNVLLALEEDDYCDFEVQFEIFHNTIHAWVGGSDEHSLSTLEFSAFDPLFLIHHSNMDRLWIVWQELQKLRGKPFNSAACAGRSMSQPMQPFYFEDLNPNLMTRENSRPINVFDHHSFGYEYDSLNLNDLSIAELQSYITKIQQYDRVFIGFNTHGFYASANIDFYICKQSDEDCDNFAGSFSVLGGPTEMPWAFERPFKYEVTELFTKLNYQYTDDIRVRTVAKATNGSAIKADFSLPFVVYRPSRSDNDVYVISIGENRNPANKIVAKRGTRLIFNPFSDNSGDHNYLMDLSSYTPFFRCDVPEFGFQTYSFNREYQPSPGIYYFTSADRKQCQAGAKFILEIAEF